jgi:glycosyltransferase involved in cell wall biosynthesis
MIAVVLVTHNSQQFLPELLASIDRQTLQPDIKIAVDDNSTDSTRELLANAAFTVIPARGTDTDTTTRIAQNFVQVVTAAREAGANTVIIGDHDDVWHPHRIKHQHELLVTHEHVSVLASNGRTPEGNLRTTFPVPENFNESDIKTQWKYAVKHSIATGGASAIAPLRISMLSVPNGWLHDRWWSLRAVREASMWIDPELVIDYRVTPEQQVGLNTADQGNTAKWLGRKLRQMPTTARKMKDISQLLADTKTNKS